MQEMTADQHKQIIDELQSLNAKLERQNSLRHIATTGLIYGVGFVLGSTILATILIGVLLPYVQDIGWVRDSFIRGASLR